MVGFNTGGGIPLGVDTGLPVAGYPRVAGKIMVAVADGSGGWFIGGDFTGVGGLPRRNLAHILVTGQVADWAPDPDHAVRALALDGGTLFVGGDFNSIGGQARYKVASVDVASGSANSWDPSPSGYLTGTVVFAIAVQGDTVIVGGDFTRIGGQPRSCLAALDSQTGEALGWNPSPNYRVHAVTLDGGIAYVGGEFSSIGGQPRGRLAAVGLADGAVTDWDPRVRARRRPYQYPDPSVWALALNGGVLYIGGDFDSLGGEPRAAVGAVDAATAAATSWNPSVGGAFPWPEVRALAARGDTVYLGGWFSTVQGQPRMCLAGVRADTGAPIEWDPNPDEEVWALALNDDRIYVGGAYASLGTWQARNNLAAFDLTTGRVTDWNPDPNGLIVYSLAVKDGVVYAGGDFSRIGGQARTGIAALDAVTGAATSWNAGSNGSVSAVVVRGDTVYLGGGFRQIGGQPRRFVASLDASTGLATHWDPNANSDVWAMALNGNTMYLGGSFTSMGPELRKALAAVDATTGALLAWKADANRSVNALALSGNTLYVAGVFDTLGGQRRRALAALDASTGSVKDWNPDPSGCQDPTYPCAPYRPMRAIATLDRTIFVGGDFSRIGGQSRTGLAAVDDSIGAATDWNPGANAIAWSLYVSGSTLYAGGKFSRIGGLPTARLAAITFPRSETRAAPSLALAQSAPNPTRTTAMIRFSLPTAMPVTLGVFDVQGRQVASLLKQQVYSAGDHHVLVRADLWNPGVYFYSLEANGSTATRKMLVVR